MKFLGRMAILCLTCWVTSPPFSPPPALVCDVSSVRQRERCVPLPTAQLFITPLEQKVRSGPWVSSLKQKAVSQRLLSFFFFFFKIFCVCGPFLKSLLNLLQYCFCLLFWFFGREACGMLTPRPGIEPNPPALEGKALTTGFPGKPPPKGFLWLIFINQMSLMCPPQTSVKQTDPKMPRGVGFALWALWCFLRVLDLKLCWLSAHSEV